MLPIKDGDGGSKSGYIAFRELRQYRSVEVDFAGTPFFGRKINTGGSRRRSPAQQPKDLDHLRANSPCAKCRWAQGPMMRRCGRKLGPNSPQDRAIAFRTVTRFAASFARIFTRFQSLCNPCSRERMTKWKKNARSTVSIAGG